MAADAATDIVPATSTRLVVLTMAVASLPFLWQGAMPMAPLMAILAWWRLGAAGRVWRVPSALARLALVAPVAAVIVATDGFLLGQPIALLLAAVWLKLVEMRRFHDHHVQIQFCLLLVTAQMLDAIGPLGTIYAAASFLFCLIGLQRTADEAADTLPWGDSIRDSMVILAKALPVAAIIFLLAPRTTVPLGFRNTRARTGVSAILDAGSIARLADDDSRAFTVTFADGKRPPRAQWYWRGPMLWRIDDQHRWYGGDSRTAIRQPGLPDDDTTRPHWRQEIILEAHHQRWAFALDHPLAVDDPLGFVVGHGLRTRRRVDDRLSFTVTSATGPVAALPEEVFIDTRSLPEGLDPRIRALADTLRHPEAPETAAAILAWMEDQSFRYTRSPGVMSGDPTADFLFEQRRGFCGHYASAFAILMRAAGHRARIVIGYRGGRWNPYGRFIDVRQRNAHAWSEIHQPGRGWLRIDPTDIAQGDPVDPDDEDDATNGGLVDGGGRGPGWLRDFRMVYDSIDRAWLRFIHSYDESLQHDLLSFFGLADGLLILVPLLAAAMALGAAWLVVRWLPRRRGHHRDPARRLWDRFCRRAAAAGCPRLPHEGPLDFAARTTAAFPHAATAIERFTAGYIAARYGPPTRAPGRSDLGDRLRACRLR